jgi:hypothetical protein
MKKVFSHIKDLLAEADGLDLSVLGLIATFVFFCFLGVGACTISSAYSTAHELAFLKSCTAAGNRHYECVERFRKSGVPQVEIKQ